MQTATNNNAPNDFGIGEYVIPLLGELVIGPGESVEMSDEDALGIWASHPHHPDITFSPGFPCDECDPPAPPPAAPAAAMPTASPEPVPEVAP